MDLVMYLLLIGMSNNIDVTMLVCWKKQRRLINVKMDEDFNTIEQLIIKSYQLEQFHHFQEYQIQYYDEAYQTFIDLSSQTIGFFQKLVEKLQSFNAPTKDHQIWRLRIIPKAIKTIREVADDEESVNNTILSSLATTTEAVTLQTDDRNVNFDNPLKFHFENDIANRQRKQYESDVRRKQSPHNSASTGGVFLRASTLNSKTPYPTLQFEIPESKWQSSWCLYLYILTESDSNGNYYLHASKGIYDGLTMVLDKIGPIPNSNLVNPHKIELSSSDIKQGKFEIRLRVCNIRNLPDHKNQKLRKFPETGYFFIYEDDNLLSKSTTADLNLNSQKYHLGCTLVCDNYVKDRCVSSLTIDDLKRKRKS